MHVASLHFLSEPAAFRFQRTDAEGRPVLMFVPVLQFGALRTPLSSGIAKMCSSNFAAIGLIMVPFFDGAASFRSLRSGRWPPRFSSDHLRPEIWQFELVQLCTNSSQSRALAEPA